MFDLSGAQAPPVRDALDAGTIDAVREALSAALESPSGLDAARLVDAIRALERLVCVATAAQAHLTTRARGVPMR